MSLFIKKKKGNLKDNGFSNKASGRFQEAIEKSKIKVAGWLNQKTNAYSPAQKKVGLIIFCILFGSFCFAMLAGSIRARSIKSHFLIVTHLIPGVQAVHPLISDSLFIRIEKAVHFLDSLRNNDSPKFKAIILNRPTLLNNLHTLENIYHSQNK
jgi:hypothetical protein